MSFFEELYGSIKDKSGIVASFLKGRIKKREKLKLVIGLNYVDMMEPYDWDTEINLPSQAQKLNIEARKREIAVMLREVGVRVPQDQIVAYSALQCYKLGDLLGAMASAAKDSFIFEKFKPKSFLSKTGEELRNSQTVMKLLGEEAALRQINSRELMREHLKKILPTSDYEKVRQSFEERLATPPKVMLLGQAGVGKTTTVAGLLGEEVSRLSISHVDTGTKKIEKHSITYNGETIDLYDLPGYGVVEDGDYMPLYKSVLSECDVVLFVLKATNGMFLPDQVMIKNVFDWLNDIR